MKLSEIIKQYRSDNDVSMDEFASRAGVSKSYISMIENEKNARNEKPISPTLITLSKIAVAMGMTIDELMNIMDKYAGVSLAPVPQAAPAAAVRIPVLGSVAAGIPIDAVENVIDYEEITQAMARDGEYFGLRIKGDSMEPKISDGDIVIVRKQDAAEDGDLVIALVNGNDGCCKRLRKYENGSVALVSTNPAYDPMYFSADEVDNAPVRIIGKVKELRVKF